jgi:tetratricopeptide (TPR) repeat protein
LISISTTPGGNPAALGNPEAWAIEFAICEDCKQFFCDRCVRERARRFGAARCPSCDGRLLDGRRRWEQVRSLPYPQAVTTYNAGMELAKAGQLDAGLSAFDMAVRLRPEYPAAHFHRGIALRDLGRLTQAVEALDLTLRVDPGNALAAFDKGLILSRLVRPAQAIAAYRQAIDIEPRYAGARINLAITLDERGASDEALRIVEEAIRLIETKQDVDDDGGALPYAWGAKGGCLLAQRRYQEALDAFDRAIDIGLDDGTTYENRSRALEGLGRYDEARFTRQLARDADPRSS